MRIIHVSTKNIFSFDQIQNILNILLHHKVIHLGVDGIKGTDATVYTWTFILFSYLTIICNTQGFSQ